MKKKIKDLTLSEMIAICDITDNHSCLTGECKLGGFCWIFQYGQYGEIVPKRYRNILESEVETI